jgi:hypothetical protein
VSRPLTPTLSPGGGEGQRLASFHVVPAATLLALLGLSFIGQESFGADIPKVPVPNSPYIKLVYAYADTMLERGRDTYGPQKTGLFLSALDRTTLQPLTKTPPAPAGIREEYRVRGDALAGADPQHDENLLRLLYALSELSAKAKYRDAADAELKWFLENAASTKTQRLPFGASRDVIKDTFMGQTDPQTFFRPWMLWDRCFQLAAEPSKLAALRMAQSPSEARQTGTDFPREAGFNFRTWAVAYAKTKEDRLLTATELLLAELEKQGVAVSTPSLAIDCDGAAHHLPKPVAAGLRSLAARQDHLFCSVSHRVKETGGFMVSRNEQGHQPTSLWKKQAAGYTTAQIAMMCVSRYDNTGKMGYRKLLIEAADAYLDWLPEPDVDAWPGTFGQAISLEVAAWRHTADIQYFERARKLADFAIEKFLDKTPLPRASLKSEHYESITGADTLMLALLELHLNVLHITAVRCPPNTIDR